MLIINNGDLLKLVTSAAVTVDVHVSWADRVDSTEVSTPDRTDTAISTQTTTTICGAPASGSHRNVEYITIKNKHASSSVTVTLLHNNGTIDVEGPKWTLLAGEMAVFANSVWFVYDSTGAVKATTMAVDPRQNDFRLTGVSATPVMTADSTTLGTIYLAQYKGNRLALNDGTYWQLLVPTSEVSLAVTGRTTDLPFDIFGYSNAGTATLEFLDWTNATTRATGLTRVDGVWTKTGDVTRRYLGSCRARSATTFHFVRAGVDLPAKFDLFNADNRVDHNFSVIATTDTWTYTTATIRQAQASANYQLDVMVGLQEEALDIELQVASKNSTISIARNVGIGYDSTTAITGVAVGTSNTVASVECSQTARLCHQPAVGRHYYAWLEISTATGTCTWMGDNAALRIQSGMTGIWTC